MQVINFILSRISAITNQITIVYNHHGKAHGTLNLNIRIQ
jgi:hypothetical protein